MDDGFYWEMEFPLESNEQRDVARYRDDTSFLRSIVSWVTQDSLACLARLAISGKANGANGDGALVALFR